MRYNFKNILDEEVYNNTRVMLVTGKYQLFNNLVADTLKELSLTNRIPNSADEALADEFNLGDDDTEVASTSTTIDSFFDLVDVANLYGKWYCRVSLESLTSKQKDRIFDYMKNPSRNAILVLMSTDWLVYKDFIKNKIFNTSQYVNLMQLSFPNKNIVKNILASMFENKGYEVENKALELFITRLNTEYDLYEETIDSIASKHKEKTITYEDMKVYLRGIEYYDIDDFMYELVKPLSSGKTTNKKIIRMLNMLKEKYEPEVLVNKLVKNIEEMIDYRTMINKGYITINIRYIFSDVVKLLGKDNKYAKVNEWVFRRKADLASLTSLRDWTYMRLILMKALTTGFPETIERKIACERALYALVNRSVYSESRINNIVGVDNVLGLSISTLNKIVYDENKLKQLEEE